MANIKNVTDIIRILDSYFNNDYIERMLGSHIKSLMSALNDNNFGEYTGALRRLIVHLQDVINEIEGSQKPLGKMKPGLFDRKTKNKIRETNESLELLRNLRNDLSKLVQDA